MIRSNDVVNVVQGGKPVGTGRILEADYTRKASEVFIVRIAPKSKADFSRNIFAAADDLTFVERPSH